MKLMMKERLVSWFDSFNVYDEDGDIYFKVKGKLAWGHKLVIYDRAGNELGMVKEKIVDILPHFNLYIDGEKVGSLHKQLTVIRPKFKVDYNGWNVKGNWIEWDYTIFDEKDHTVASIYKKLVRLTDTYVIEVKDPADALGALMVVLAIDAEKCTREHKEELKEAKIMSARKSTGLKK